jgi:uncharacterized membrane protein YqaE (UPF0057 family)
MRRICRELEWRLQPADYSTPCHDAGRLTKEPPNMRLLLAIFLPFVVFFTIGRPIAGVICLVLQITILGWLPAAIWAVYALSQYKTDRKIEAALGKKAL